MVDDSGLAGKKILVIDDEPDIVTFISTVLEDHGMVAITAADGVEGLAKARAERPDLVTLDISMPEKSGVRVLRELEADPELDPIPVVVVTGLASEFEGFIHKRRKLKPPDGYIGKPITEEQVISVLHKLLVG